MSAEKIIKELGKFCEASTGDFMRWQGRSGQYHWNRGRDKSTGEINGVVRKLAGTDATGHQIWVVAGSFKIAANGTILRFTGLSKENWRQLEAAAITPIEIVETTVTEAV
jgi:hypothetical protein